MGFVLIWIICAIASAIVASSKGRSGFGWFLLGFFFGPFGLLAAIGVTKVEPRSYLTNAPELRPCSSCAEMIQPAAIKCRFCGADVEPIKHFAPVAIPGESEAARMMRLQNEARGKKANPAPEPWSAKSRKQAAIAGAGIVALLLTIAGLQNAGILPRPRSSEATLALQAPIASPAPYRARIAPGIDSPWDANHYPKLVAKLGRKSFDRATGKFPAVAEYAAHRASCDEVADIGISSHSTASSVSYFATCANAFQIKISETELDGHNNQTANGLR